MAERIRIAFIINTIVAPSGGTEKQLLFLLKELDREIFEPHLFCLYSNAWLEEEFDLCPLHVLGIQSFKTPFFAQRLAAFAKILRKEGFSIVQTHFADGNTVGILGARLAGVPVIISTRRGIPYWSKPAGLSMLRLLNSRATFFIANSWATRQWASQAEGIPLDKIEVVHNGIDPEVYVQKGKGGRSCRRALNIPSRAPVVGIVANLRPVKGIEIFIRAAALVVREISETYFLIIGEGDEEANLSALAEKLGVGERVLFLGKREDVPVLLSAMEVGVLSSHWESFSNAILEYLAAGLPVICTDVGGCREVVRDGRDGYIVAPGDAQGMAEKIILLLRRGFSSAERRQLQRRMMEEFSIDAMVTGHQDIYLRLLQGAVVPQPGVEG